MNNAPYCRDCEYFGGGIYLLCKAPQNGISSVTGEIKPLMSMVARGDSKDNACGPTGRFFKQKVVVGNNKWWNLLRFFKKM